MTRWADRRDQGLCGRCGVHKTTLSLCAGCQVKQAVAMAKRYEKAQSAGLCVGCAQRPPTPFRVRCAPCLAKVRRQ